MARASGRGGELCRLRVPDGPHGLGRRVRPRGLRGSIHDRRAPAPHPLQVEVSRLCGRPPRDLRAHPGADLGGGGRACRGSRRSVSQGHGGTSQTLPRDDRRAARPWRRPGRGTARHPPRGVPAVVRRHGRRGHIRGRQADTPLRVTCPPSGCGYARRTPIAPLRQPHSDSPPTTAYTPARSSPSATSEQMRASPSGVKRSRAGRPPCQHLGDGGVARSNPSGGIRMLIDRIEGG